MTDPGLTDDAAKRMPMKSTIVSASTESMRVLGSRLAFADGLRGLAALWVVLFHLSEGHHIDALKQRLPAFLDTFCFDLGHLGVAIFFVLSGFVMALTADKAIVDASYSGRFLLRRLLRLTPPYYFAIAFSLLVQTIRSQALGQALQPISFKSLLAHAFYAQDLLGIPDINVVFWTLCIEVQFYIAFAAIMWLADRLAGTQFARHAIRAVVLTTAAVIALGWPLAVFDATAWPGSFLPLWYAFLAGVLAFSGWRHKGYQLAVAAAYALAVLGVALARHDSFAAATAVTCAALLLSMRKDGMTRWLSPRPFQFIGIISYSLYLLHNPLTGMTFRVMNRLLRTGGAGAELVGALMTIAVCVGSAWLCFRLVELPSIAWSHAIKLKRSGAN